MALLNGGKAHPVAATVGTLGGIVAMPFVTAGTAVAGALGTVAFTIPTLGLAAVPGALLTAGATVTSVFVSPVLVGNRIYNALVPEEDSIYLCEEAVGNVVESAYEFTNRNNPFA